MWNHEKQAETFFDNYVNLLTKSHLMTDCVPLAKKIEAYWNSMTGHEAEMNCYLGNFYMYVDMGQEMENGEYPDKGYHLGLLLEFTEDLLKYRLDPKRERTDSLDKYDQNFVWHGHSYWPSWQIHASHGGNCRLVEVDRIIEERPVYETVCD